MNSGQSGGRYFAYGSNMHPEVLLAPNRCPDAEVLSRAQLPDFQLEFPRLSIKRQCGVAGIRPEAGSVVHGVVYDLSTESFARLDRAEGVASGAYYREPMAVLLPDGSMIDVDVYRCAESGKHVAPSEAYMSHLIAGARLNGLPEEYVRYLESIETLRSE